jgi:hypothetical protein
METIQPTSGTKPIHHHQPVWSESCSRRTASAMLVISIGMPMTMSRMIPATVERSEITLTTA